MNGDTISKEDLFKERIEQAKKIEELILEIERLNNIINELESYLNQEILEWQDVDNIQTKSRVEEDQFILDKLKELKENK